MSELILQARGLGKVFRGGLDVNVLTAVDLTIAAG